MIDVLVTFTILGAVLLWAARAERRRMEREAAREAREQARGDWDRLDALIRDSREKPHESHAWPPADRLPQADYVTVRVIDDCGCLRWLIHPDGFVEPAYGPCPADAALAEVEQTRRPR